MISLLSKGRSDSKRTSHCEGWWLSSANSFLACTLAPDAHLPQAHTRLICQTNHGRCRGVQVSKTSPKRYCDAVTTQPQLTARLLIAGSLRLFRRSASAPLLAMSCGDIMSDLTEFRAEKDEFFGRHPQSPLTPEQKRGFKGLEYFPENESLRLEVQVEPFPGQQPIQMQTSTGGVQMYVRFGRFKFESEGQVAELTIYESESGFFPVGAKLTYKYASASLAGRMVLSLFRKKSYE